MQTLSRSNGIAITAVLGVLFGCAGLLACPVALMNIGYFLEVFTPGPGIRSVIETMYTACAGLGFIALPIVFYILLVRGRPADQPPAPKG